MSTTRTPRLMISFDALLRLSHPIKDLADGLTDCNVANRANRAMDICGFVGRLRAMAVEETPHIPEKPKRGTPISCGVLAASRTRSDPSSNPDLYWPPLSQEKVADVQECYRKLVDTWAAIAATVESKRAAVPEEVAPSLKNYVSAGVGLIKLFNTIDQVLSGATLDDASTPDDFTSQQLEQPEVVTVAGDFDDQPTRYILDSSHEFEMIADVNTAELAVCQYNDALACWREFSMDLVDRAYEPCIAGYLPQFKERIEKASILVDNLGAYFRNFTADGVRDNPIF
ncbi:hypothetical protein BDW74DRAFT_179195 [Aspergillus multicolor]|uniref:uncharacterized protein n=1 Tax=Aspergillus multicolor TaxID=41759 RepID=UPI003CCE13BB